MYATRRGENPSNGGATKLNINIRKIKWLSAVHTPVNSSACTYVYIYSNTGATYHHTETTAAAVLLL